MTQQLIVQDLVIVVAAKNHSPSILNPDFLKCSGIVPQDWNLARQPIYTNNAAQVIFTNGISIIAEPNRVIFMEPIGDKTMSELNIAEIARKYVQTLPNVEYEAVGINPRGYVSFASSPDAARLYMAETLLSPGAWQESGDSPMRASLNLVYKFQRAPFYLGITEAALRNEDETSTPIVMFSGSFSYELSGENGAEKISNLHNCIENWQTDLNTYSDIINHKFLKKISSSLRVASDDSTVSVPATVPDLFTMSAATIA
ncbi:hypothetical protein WA1_49285 [Scytonema hofmannii PCC 7110]|uniref:Uncharacterized protein n=1 Tax=Scytonema hofmannii PCC 7110 TaxID=128403 RepID=A0A139WQM8_9CYAN|nr:hypothetical protein [Scytonema hofmannii]KYC34735.1 hypothetical protein WA1_49285 [Scytonema hofmannii PCC 7110]